MRYSTALPVVQAERRGCVSHLLTRGDGNTRARSCDRTAVAAASLRTTECSDGATRRCGDEMRADRISWDKSATALLFGILNVEWPV